MATDSIKPTLPADTRITVSNVTSKGFTITWQAGKDDKTPASKLRYLVGHYEVIPGATGYRPTLVNVIGKTTYTFTNLKAGTEYGVYVNLFDEADNCSKYPLIKQKTATTAASVTVTRPSRVTTPTRPSTRPSTPTTPSQPVSDAARRKAINDYMKALVYPEDAIQNAIDDENRKTRIEGNYLVKYEKITRETRATELMMSCGAHEIFPGMLLVVDNALGTLTPTQSGLPRGKVKVTIDLGNVTLPKGNWRVVSADENGSLMGNINHAINEMVEDFRKSGKTLTANFTSHTTDGRSQDELMVKAGCSASFAGIKANAKFEYSQSGFAMQFMTDYTQVFYTVTAEFDKKDYSSLFDESVTADMIKQSFGNKPIIFVKSVRYGRQFYLHEELSGSNEKMIESCSVSGFGVSVDQEFKKSKSKMNYRREVSIRGGSLQNANKIYEAAKDIVQNESESDFDFCKRQIAAIRKGADDYKKSYTTVDLKGTVENDVYGVPLSYNAERLEGINQKSAIFWRQGDFYVKRLIPNNKLIVDVFNCLNDGNIVASGWFTLFDENGRELPQIYDVQFDYKYDGDRSRHRLVGRLPNTQNLNLVNGGKNRANGRVFNECFMVPQFELPKNVYRVQLRIRHRDKSGRRFQNDYILPCGNIMAGYLKQGNGPQAVNWYFNGANDDWFNGGEYKK